MTFITGLKEIASATTELFLPRLCAACKAALHSGEECICLTCESTLPYTSLHLMRGNAMEMALKSEVNLGFACSYLHYLKGEGPQQMLFHLKYGNMPGLGVYLGRQFGILIKELALEQGAEVVVPVPLHPRKMLSRGYNQSAAIAQGLAEGIGIEVSPKALRKIRHTKSQTKKSREARQANVANMFGVAIPEAIKGKHVLLTDDVMTTGATLRACAAALTCASKISVATLAVRD